MDRQESRGQGQGSHLKPESKRQDKKPAACQMATCQHPATVLLNFGANELWVCDCHNVLEPKPCAEKRNVNLLGEAYCSICGRSPAKHPMQNLLGNMVYVCDECYHTPMNDLRRYYK